MLSDKYIAGFFDADGSFTINWEKKKLALNFSQLSSNNKILYMIREAIGGNIYEPTGKNVSYLQLHGSKAISMVNRFKNHTVVRRDYIDKIQDIVKIPSLNKAEHYGLAKEAREGGSVMPNHPTRKWLAGYTDGDGCFSGACRKKNGSFSPIYTITCSDFDSTGMKLIQKAFNGSVLLRKCPSDQSQLVTYNLPLSPSKTIQFIGYFGKHLIIKKEQADLLMRHAKMGHFRAGESIKAELRSLKGQQHRLTDREVAKINAEVMASKQYPKGIPGMFKSKYSTECKGCGRDDIKHFSKGYCHRCREKARYYEKKAA